MADTTRDQSEHGDQQRPQQGNQIPGNKGEPSRPDQTRGTGESNQTVGRDTQGGQSGQGQRTSRDGKS